MTDSPWARFGLRKNFSGAGRGLALSATLLAPVDAAGALIGYPPLHIHHAHLEKLVHGPGNGRGAHGHKVGAAVRMCPPCEIS